MLKPGPKDKKVYILITGEELSRQLAARGLMLEDDFGFGTLGGRIALSTANWLLQARLATPRGMIETLCSGSTSGISKETKECPAS